jgi:hypothetical protein
MLNAERVTVKFRWPRVSEDDLQISTDPSLTHTALYTEGRFNLVCASFLFYTSTSN